LLAALSWRFLVVSEAVVVVTYLLARLRVAVLPVFAALLLAPLAAPRVRLPSGLATLAVSVAGLGVLAGVALAVAVSLAAELEEIDVGVRDGVGRVGGWV
jgi:hypothetical protein